MIPHTNQAEPPELLLHGYYFTRISITVNKLFGMAGFIPNAEETGVAVVTVLLDPVEGWLSSFPTFSM